MRALRGRRLPSYRRNRDGHDGATGFVVGHRDRAAMGRSDRVDDREAEARTSLRRAVGTGEPFGRSLEQLVGDSRPCIGYGELDPPAATRRSDDDLAVTVAD